jgi:hypothetical protein
LGQLSPEQLAVDEPEEDRPPFGLRERVSKREARGAFLAVDVLLDEEQQISVAGCGDRTRWRAPQGPLAVPQLQVGPRTGVGDRCDKL